MAIQGTDGPHETTPEADGLGFDPAVPSPARVWNFFVGGKDHYSADRELAGKMLEVIPEIPLVAQMTRQFLQQTVTELVTVHGIRQFLDIGSGLPVTDNTHEVAQRLAPESRIVYVDNDRTVIRHAQALLRSTPQGACDYVQADLRDPGVILVEAAKTLDFSKPIAVLLIQVLHFVPDSDDPYALVARVMAAMPPGSFLAMAHGSHDTEGTASDEMSQRYNARASAQINMRTFEEFTRFFDGLDPVGPGLVSSLDWRKANAAALAGTSPRATIGHSGLARKP